MRVVICDDSLLMREGIATLLGRTGFEVAALAADPGELREAVAEHAPDVAIVDVRMPPSFTDEGLRAAHELRASHPGTAIVILSQHVEVGMAMRVLAEAPARLGYLLKDRVSDLDEFAGTLRRVAAGGVALDPEVVSRLLTADGGGPLAALSGREREVLALVAEGRSNKAIADRLEVSTRAVQKHVTAIFAALGLEHADDEDNRRVLAVLAYLRAGAPPPAASS